MISHNGSPAACLQANALRGWVNKNPRTDEIWIYLVTYTNTTGLSYIEVYEESGTLIQQYSLGAINNPDLIWMSVVQDEIMFNGPSIGTPVYGRVGGGLSKAVQTTSINPDTTTIAIPRGLCCSWQGRNVIASGNNIFVSDPQDIRAYVGDNFVNFDSQIYSLHEIGANLFVVTGSGVFAVPGETADNQIIFGARSRYLRIKQQDSIKQQYLVIRCLVLSQRGSCQSLTIM